MYKTAQTKGNRVEIIQRKIWQLSMAHCILCRSVRYHESAFITWLIQDGGTDDDGDGDGDGDGDDDDDDDDDDDEDICLHLSFLYSPSDNFSS